MRDEFYAVDVAEELEIGRCKCWSLEVAVKGRDE
jgi:hypothetical protein